MPKYIQIVAPVSAGLILDGSITTAKLASSLDLSGKTITYRSIVNADISATAAIAFSKLNAITVVSKAATETVNNSATLQNDDHLVLAVGANDLWLIIMFLQTISNATADFKGNFSLPSGGVLRAHLIHETGIYEISNAAAYAVAVTDTATHTETIIGYYKGGGTAGNLQFQWAQNTATAVDTQVLINSLMIGIKVA